MASSDDQLLEEGPLCGQAIPEDSTVATPAAAEHCSEEIPTKQ
jgi:predicted nucleic acid-binding Zn ribbon protein